MSYEMIRESLSALNLYSVLFRLLLASLFGGAIGFERGIKRRPAGLRTYMLVCIGATLVMITNQYISENFAVSDPARMGAQVVNGIGFIGAGTIIVTRHHQVKGLTTAAGLWACACMGLAIGVGFYEGAVVGTIFIFVVITIVHVLDKKVVSNSKTISLYIEFSGSEKMSQFLSYATRHSIRVNSVDLIGPNVSGGGSVAALLSLSMPKALEHSAVVKELREVDGIKFIEEV